MTNYKHNSSQNALLRKVSDSFELNRSLVGVILLLIPRGYLSSRNSDEKTQVPRVFIWPVPAPHFLRLDLTVVHREQPNAD